MRSFSLRLLLLLALCSPASAQLAQTGAGSVVGSGSGTCSKATTFLARTSGLSAAQITAYTNLICGMVQDGTWSLLDTFYILATNTTTTANLNLVSTNYGLTVNGSCTFTANAGYTGDGATCWIDTGFNLSTNGVNYTLNSASIGGCDLTNRTTNATTILIGGGEASGSQLYIIPLVSGVWGAAINDGAGLLYSATSTAQGSWIAVRTGASAEVGYTNAVQVTTSTQVSSYLPNSTYSLLAYNTQGVPKDFSTDQIAYGFTGASLTSSQVTNIFNRLAAYLTAVGAPSGCAAPPPGSINVVNQGAFGTYNLAGAGGGQGPAGTDGPYWLQIEAFYWITGPSTNGGATFNTGSTTVLMADTSQLAVGANSYAYIPGAGSFNSTIAAINPNVSITLNTAPVFASPASPATGNMNGSVLAENPVPAQGSAGVVAATQGMGYENHYYDPATFPLGSQITWGFGTERNPAGVYAFPSLVYGGYGSSGPHANPVTPLQISAISTMAVSYNISFSSKNSAGGLSTNNDGDILFETYSLGNTFFANSGTGWHGGSSFTGSIIGNVLTVTGSVGGGNPTINVGDALWDGNSFAQPANLTSPTIPWTTRITAQTSGTPGAAGTYTLNKTFGSPIASEGMQAGFLTLEISFFPYAPSGVSTYLQTFATHFNYSAGGFNAYVGMKTTGPPFQLYIMPVTAPNGTTALDMSSGNQTIPIAGVLAALTTQLDPSGNTGWVASTDYIPGWAFGFEPQFNYGQITFNSISFTWN